MGSTGIAAAAAAAVLVVAACSGPPAPPATTISEPLPSATPVSTEATGPVETVLDGFFPVESRGAAHLDFDAVGPGWFLIEWKHRSDLKVDTGSEFGLVPRAFDGLTLVAPDGTLYAVASIEDADASRGIWWYGSTIALFRETAPGGEQVLGEVVTFDLATGTSEVTRAEGAAPEWEYLVDAGRMIGATFGGESFVYRLFDGAAEPVKLCDGGRTYVTALSPDGSAFVCFDVRDAGLGTHTTVRVVDTAKPGSGRDAATFTRQPWIYEIGGWTDDTTMIFGREDKGANLVYFTFDVATDEVDGLDMPTPGSPYATRYDLASDTYRIETTESVAFFDSAGEPLAEVPCREVLPSDRAVTLSGQRALVTCRAGKAPATVTATLVDLATGVQTPFASFEAAANEAVRAVFGWDPRLDG